jgi:hypothetical protein
MFCSICSIKGLVCKEEGQEKKNNHSVVAKHVLLSPFSFGYPIPLIFCREK